jgi:hypothetical protein
MKLLERETLIVVGVSTLIGFAGEVLLFSMEESKGKKFRLRLPPVNQSLKLLGFVLVTGVVADMAVKFADKKTMSDAERSLSELYEAEKARIKAGLIKSKEAKQILWG